MLFHDLSADRQPQPGTALFRAETSFKDFGQAAGRNAWTVICDGEIALMSPVALVEVPPVSERSTRISATPTTIPETVKAVLSLRLRRLFIAISIDDAIFSIRSSKVLRLSLRVGERPTGPFRYIIRLVR